MNILKRILIRSKKALLNLDTQEKAIMQVSEKGSALIKEFEGIA